MKKIPDIIAYLKARDPVLGRVMRGQTLEFRQRAGDPYSDLLHAVMSQQLSGKAASTIIGRFMKIFPGENPEPALVLKLTDEQFRSAGVSRQKAGYLRNIAEFTKKGGLDRDVLKRMSDAEVIEHLTEIKGVGRWTAEMLLMFTLNRPDVMPVDDLGIQNAMIRFYGLRSRGRKLHARMIDIAESWRPYRTYACRYLWHAKDNAPNV